MVESVERVPNEPSARQRARSAMRRIESFLPPVRVLWIGLLVLAVNAIWFFGTGLGLLSVLVLPTTALLVDLLFQRARFEHVRFSDAALATGLFLALLFPPNVPILAGIGATIAAVGVRHVARVRGHPWFNPAAAGLFLGALLFGLAPAWWGSLNETLLLAVGAVVVLANRRRWRLPVTFLLVFAVLAIVQRLVQGALVGGGSVPLNVLILSALDPALLFFGLLMVPEPRTAPSNPAYQPMFAVAVAAGASLGPWFFPTLAPVVALLLANLLVAAGRALPLYQPLKRSRPAGETPARRSAAPTPARWPIPSRVGAALALFLVVALMIPFAAPYGNEAAPIFVSSGPGHVGGGLVSSGATAGGCLKDNPKIPSSTLKALHAALGPSVILSDNPSNGVVVFYDPVNEVTVTETDLYEDFGYAEFNGDDAVTSGCAG